MFKIKTQIWYFNSHLVFDFLFKISNLDYSMLSEKVAQTIREVKALANEDIFKEMCSRADAQLEAVESEKIPTVEDIAMFKQSVRFNSNCIVVKKACIT